MNILIKHFIIASRAYSQQSPTCTRVNNLVYIFSIQHPWSLDPCTVVYSSLCSLQNVNVTCFDITSSSHDKLHHHNMFGYRVRFAFPFYAYMTYDQSKELSHSMCTRNTLNLETKFRKPKYYIF